MYCTTVHMYCTTVHMYCTPVHMYCTIVCYETKHAVKIASIALHYVLILLSKVAFNGCHTLCD